jgi:NADH:ubiquinone oxidoreductase subunit E
MFMDGNGVHKTPEHHSSGVEVREISDIVRDAIHKHGVHYDALIPILGEVNKELGYIPAAALSEVRKQLHGPEERIFVSESQLFSLASFYSMFATQPRGRHVVQFCESAPCHVQGGRELIKVLQEALELKPGETSADGKWSLVMTSCLGVCAVGPVILVDEDIYGNVTPGQLPMIFAKYD